MQKRLDSQALEPWIERLVEARSRAEREDVLSAVASQLEGVHAVSVWRELTIGGELLLTPTTTAGDHESLPNASQVRAVVAGELSPTGLSRVRVLGTTLAGEAPVLALCCDTVEEVSLDSLEALLNLTRLVEQDSEEGSLDSVRGLLRDLGADPEET